MFIDQKNTQIVKLPTVTMLSTAIVFSLATLMSGLVAQDEVRIIETKNPTITPYIEDILPEKPREIERVKKPEVLEVPETTIPDNIPEGTDPTIFTISGPTKDIPHTPEGFDLASMAEGDLLPIVVVQASYPRRALEQGIEGYVILSLTVLPDGTVGDVAIVEAEPKGYFERSATTAAKKFKYKPRVVDGVAQTVKDVLYKVSFALGE